MMNKNRSLLSLLLILCLWGKEGRVEAQCTFLTNPVAGPVLQTSGGSSTRSSVAWNPFDSLYYSFNAGSSSYPLETFGPFGGNSIFSTTCGFDFRGAWWNPLLNQLEGNGYNTSGLRQVNLSALGYAQSTGTVIFTGQNQPNTQVIGAFDFDNNEIIYYDNGVIYKYDRINNNSAGNVALTGTPVALSNLARYVTMYTGCPGNEYALFDRNNKRVYLYNKSTGVYSQTIQLPPACPTPNDYGAAFANNHVWVFDPSARNWVSYQILLPCVPPTASLTLNGPSTFCQGETGMLTTFSQSGVTYQWLLNGQAIPAATDTVYFASQSGSYQLVANNGGCRDTSAAQAITVLPLPTASLSQNGLDSICFADTLYLSVNSPSGVAYQWYESNNSLLGETGMSLAIGDPGTYYVKVTDTNSCFAYSDSLTVIVNSGSAAVITVVGSNNICTGDSALLKASSPNGTGLSFQWTFAGNIIPGETADSLFATQTGVYGLILTNSSGCSSSTNATIAVIPPPNPSLTVAGNDLSVAATFSNYQWYMNGGPVSGATANNFTATGSGQYYVVVTDNFGCVGSSDTLDLIVGLDPDQLSEVQLYPNPGQDRFQLAVSGSYFGEIRLELYDLQGRQVRTQSLQKTGARVETSFSTGDLSRGLYHLRLVAGETILIKKWVKD